MRQTLTNVQSSSVTIAFAISHLICANAAGFVRNRSPCRNTCAMHRKKAHRSGCNPGYVQVRRCDCYGPIGNKLISIKLYWALINR